MNRYCPNCGTQISEGARFCAGCGKTVHAGQPEAQPEAPWQEEERPRARQGTVPSTSGAASSTAAAGQATFAAATRWLGSAWQRLDASQGPSIVGGEAAGGGAAAASNWRTYLALALLAVAALADGTANTAIWSKAIGVLWLAATVLLVLDAVKPDLLGRVSAWLRRPRLGSVAAAVFALFAATYAGFSFSFFAAVAGTAVFLWDAVIRGELGSFDPRGLVRGWRILILAGVLLASFQFSQTWLGGFDYNRTWEEKGPTSGTVTKFREEGGMEGRTAQDLQLTTLPTALMLSLLAWSAWRPGGDRRPPWWMRFVPVGLVSALVAWGVYQWVATQQYYDDAPQASLSTGHLYHDLPAGPSWFTLSLLPLCLAVAVLTLKRNPWPAPRTPRG